MQKIIPRALGFGNLDSARESKIEASSARAPNEEDHSQNQAARGIKPEPMNLSKFNTKAIFLFLLNVLPILSIDACTGIQLTANDGAHVHGRTLEFGVKIDLSLVVIPRDYAFTGTTPLGKGLSYQAKYAVVGSIAYNSVAIVDGLNEKGLAIGVFYFPTFAEYTPITSENQSMALSPTEFPNWVITQFATVEEVKAALSSVVIAPTALLKWGPTPPPFHYVVYDKQGNSLVIEPLEGKLVAYDNPLGVCTNSPAFDWHMAHLRNYINLKPENVKPIKMDGVELTPLSQGSGMVGLPGDFTSPSRFIQAALFAYTAIPSKNAEQAIFQLFHILNHFDIPLGTVRATETNVVHMEWTSFTCARDPQALKYYFKSYDDQTIKFVDLNQFDLNAKTIKKATPAGFQTTVDFSTNLK